MPELMIGRVGALENVSVEKYTHSGGDFTLTGWVEGGGDMVSATLEQLNGYRDSADEQVVPVIFDCMPHLTGYYRVTDVSADRPDAEDSDFRVELQRVRGFAAPLFEVTSIGGKRVVDAASPAPFQHWMALPASVRGFETGTVTPQMHDRLCEPEPGEVESQRLTVFRASILANGRAEFYLPPRDWYRGAPRLVVDGHLVVGRQVRNMPSSWSVSNGIVELSGMDGGGVWMRRWTDAGWVDVGEWHVGRPYGGWTPANLLGEPHTLTVLQNSPEEVRIKVSHDAAALVPGARFVVDMHYRLRRGASHVEVDLRTRGWYQWGLVTPIGASPTVESRAYIHKDRVWVTRGDTYAVSSPSALGGRVTLSTYQNRQAQKWGIGFVPDGEATIDVVGQYMSAAAERTQVVAR